MLGTPRSQCGGARDQSLVEGLDPTCMLQLGVRMPQLRSPRAAAGGPARRNRDPAQPDNIKKKKKKEEVKGSPCWVS